MIQNVYMNNINDVICEQFKPKSTENDGTQIVGLKSQSPFQKLHDCEG